MNFSIKTILYGQVERLAKGLASAKRLELLEILCESPRCVEELAMQAGLNVKLTSSHLKELRLAHLVEVERSGRQMIYRIACAEVAGLLVALRGLAKSRQGSSGEPQPSQETDGASQPAGEEEPLQQEGAKALKGGAVAP